jgi:23S rRNA (guanosine2251-2'-O)-methyltransferase
VSRSRRPQHRRPNRPPADDAPALDPGRSVYGRHPVREALRGQRRVLRVWGTDAALRDVDPGHGVEVRETSPADLVELVGTADHQGIVAETEGFPYCEIDDLLRGESPVVLCLDQITDPHNLGSIARVCEASGCSGLLIPAHGSVSVTAAACKASAGALEHVRVARCTNLADTIDRVKGNDLWAYAASEKATRLYSDVDFAGGVLLVLGSEGAGVRPRVQSVCDDLISVPMRGKVSSLNVSTVAALLAYEVVRQRGVPS